MELKDVDTSKFLENPKKEDFVDRMIKRSPVFNLNINRVNTKKVLTYLTLVYDKESYFRRDIKSYGSRKTQAGITAGFSLRKTSDFDPYVEKAMLGENPSFNKALVQYLALLFDIEYTRLIIYELNYYKKAESATQSLNDKDKTLFDKLALDMRQLEVDIFGGEETISARKALYEGTAQTRNNLRIEDKNKEYKLNGLHDSSPYGKLYFQTFPTFAGDKPPRDDPQVRRS